MKHGKGVGISLQVTLAVCGIFVVAVLGLSLIAHVRATSLLDQRWESDLTERVRLIHSQFDTFDTTARGNADRLSRVFESQLGGAVRVDSGRTVQVGGRVVPSVQTSSGVLNLDFTQVDSFSRLTGGVATVFVRVGDEFVRVTTSLKKEDGSRAVGTALDAKHPAYRSMLEGQPYLGKARLFGRDYMTKYVPVLDGAGRSVAALFVGFDITDGLAKLLSDLAKARIGRNGYFFVVDASNQASRGELIVHPLARGANVTTTSGLQALADVLHAGEGTLRRDGHVYVFSAYGPWQRVVGATADIGELHADSRVMGGVLLAVGLLAIIGGGAGTYVFLRHKLQPLERLARDAERIGSGDLTVVSSIDTRDEVGELARAFNHMSGQVRDLVIRVKRASESVRDGVVQVRGESQQVRQGSEQQSESASRVAAALEQVNASLNGVAGNAVDSQGLSRRTNDLSLQGESVAARAAEETAAIAAAVRDSAHAISSLSVRSDQISQVVKVIRDIADQTNLLALNAAIEAARAGEQGRGFAVVADEVRKLAERTSQATLEIGAMIETIQKETAGAVEGMRGGSERVDQGVRLVREVASALAEIRAAAEQTATKSAEITSAMNEQNSAGQEITNNVERIAQMAEENSAAAARSQQTVDRLDSLARDLASLTAGLRTEGRG